jgi:starch phosphorylase
VHIARDDDLRRRIVFLEKYDINLARFLVQGADVWLNTPRRGMEASGTSGMKVLANGGINLSILDGWWCEGYSHETGWAIGSGESYTDTKYQDEVESRAIYDLLEKDVVPLFYQRGSDRLPRGWVKMMKNSMRMLSSHFATSRMVAEYAQSFYLPCARRRELFQADDFNRAKALAAWKESMRDRWSEVSVGKVDIISKGELQVGKKMKVRCQVSLGSIDPNDVVVELYYGQVDGDGNIVKGEAVPMEHKGTAQENYHVFTGSITCRSSGLCGFTVRVVPYHLDLISVYDTCLIRWEEPISEKSRTKAVPQELV